MYQLHTTITTILPKYVLSTFSSTQLIIWYVRQTPQMIASNLQKRSFLDLFKYEERSLWIFFFMIYGWHTLRPLVKERPCSLCCMCVFDSWFSKFSDIIFTQTIITSYLTNYWPYSANPTAVYVTIAFHSLVSLDQVSICNS